MEHAWLYTPPQWTTDRAVADSIGMIPKWCAALGDTSAEAGAAYQQARTGLRRQIVWWAPEEYGKLMLRRFGATLATIGNVPPSIIRTHVIADRSQDPPLEAMHAAAGLLLGGSTVTAAVDATACSRRTVAALSRTAEFAQARIERRLDTAYMVLAGEWTLDDHMSAHQVSRSQARADVELARPHYCTVWIDSDEDPFDPKTDALV